LSRAAISSKKSWDHNDFKRIHDFGLRLSHHEVLIVRHRRDPIDHRKSHLEQRT